jgi:hypothetical protein
MNNRSCMSRLYSVATFGALSDRALAFVRFYRFMM